jgi:hypothetical protein
MKLWTTTLLALAAVGATGQGPVSAYDFRDTLNPYIDANPPHVFPLEHRTGGSPTTPYGPTLYTDATVGSTQKRVAILDAPQFFRALHGMNKNGGGGYVNLYSIVLDVKVESPTIGEFDSLFNTNADNANDGDSFIRWDDNGSGSPVGRIGISGVYAGDITPNEWHRIVVTVDCTANGGANTVLTYFVDGVQVNQVDVVSGLDGRWAAYSWDDPDFEDNIDLFGDDDGDNMSGYASLAVFFDRVLDANAVTSLGPVGTEVSNRRRFAPDELAIALGQVAGGDVSSLAASDGNSLRVCKFFVPFAGSPYARVNVFANNTGLTTVSAATVELRDRSVTAGLFRRTLLAVLSGGTGAARDTLVTNAFPTSFADYSLPLTAGSGALSDYLGTNGRLGARLEVLQTGPSASLTPCSEFDKLNWVVTQ